MPRDYLLLDLYSGAGGAGAGYARAGFRVVGVDSRPMPRYPFEFHQADALEVLDALAATGEWRGLRFDAIHASPPCRDHSKLAALRGTVGTGWLLAATRERLERTGRPWVIENVPGAPMRADFRLCGCLLDLPRLPDGRRLRRERWFETNWHATGTAARCKHPGRAVTVAGHPGGTSRRDGPAASFADWQAAMDVDWMSCRELAQAIPPAYTEFIGRHLMAVVQETEAPGQADRVLSSQAGAD